MKTIKFAVFIVFTVVLLMFGLQLYFGQTESTVPAVMNAPISEEASSQTPTATSPPQPVSEQPDSTNTLYSNSFPDSGVPVLMYHSISTDSENSNCVSQEQFTEEMEWLYRHNYHPLTMEEFEQSLTQGAPVPENPILITLDDGYSDNYQTAWPILKQYGFHATFFIISNSVSPDSIDWDQLSELVSQGNSIGSHSVHHYDLATLTDKQQEYELRESKQVLEDHLGTEIKAFCFPSGKYNEKTLSLLSQLGYTLSFTTKSGRAYPEDNPYELHRVRIWNGMSLAGFADLVS